jgi:hypothetical protein
MPLAENCWGSANETLGLDGVTWIDISVIAFTVRSVLPDTPASVAVIVVNPAPTDLTSPLESTVATAVFDELQVTAVVRSGVVLSEYVPVAVYCCEVPRAMLGRSAVTSMVWRTAEVTVMVMLPETVPVVAVIVAEPTVTAAASPLESTVAIAIFDEIQVTAAVRSWRELSE